MRLIKSLKLLREQQLSIMQQFGASAFNTVMRWHKLGDVNGECTAHNIGYVGQKLSHLVRIWLTFWQKQTRAFLAYPVVF